MDNNIQKKKLEQSKKAANDLARYSGMAFQMIAIILAGLFGGRGLDRAFHTKKPVFTAILIVLAVFIAIYIVVKDLLKKQ